MTNVNNNENKIDKMTLYLIERLIGLISIIFIVILIGFAYFFHRLHNSDIYVNQSNEPWVCGTPGLYHKSKSIHDTLNVEYGNIDLGKKLFRNYCAMCHNKNMIDDLTGPALGGITERWKEHPQEDLYRFIRNSQEMIKSEHPRANKLWEEWKPIVMNAFEDLTDEEIEAIIAYIEYINR